MLKKVEFPNMRNTDMISHEMIALIFDRHVIKVLFDFILPFMESKSRLFFDRKKFKSFTYTHKDVKTASYIFMDLFTILPTDLAAFPKLLEAYRKAWGPDNIFGNIFGENKLENEEIVNIKEFESSFKLSQPLLNKILRTLEMPTSDFYICVDISINAEKKLKDDVRRILQEREARGDLRELTD